ncbi:unnamed protein product, partial [Choristocarpus tenellus]
ACTWVPLQTDVEGPVLEADTGRSSTVVRKRPHPTTQTLEPNTRVRLTAAHFRPHRDAREM